MQFFPGGGRHVRADPISNPRSHECKILFPRARLIPERTDGGFLQATGRGGPNSSVPEDQQAAVAVVALIIVITIGVGARCATQRTCQSHVCTTVADILCHTLHPPTSVPGTCYCHNFFKMLIGCGCDFCKACCKCCCACNCCSPKVTRPFPPHPLLAHRSFPQTSHTPSSPTLL